MCTANHWLTTLARSTHATIVAATRRHRPATPTSRHRTARLGSRVIRSDRGNIEAAPYWSELPFFAALGIPGVYFAPGDIRICHTAEERVVLQDYYDGILALALFLAGSDG